MFTIFFKLSSNLIKIVSINLIQWSLNWEESQKNSCLALFCHNSQKYFYFSSHDMVTLLGQISVTICIQVSSNKYCSDGTLGDKNVNVVKI